MTFCETFRKNVARVECAAHHERLYNVWVRLKRYILQRISPKCQIFSWVISRSSLPEVFFKRDVLENFANFKGNCLYWSLSLIKFQSSSPQLYFKKSLQHRCFPMNFAKFSRTTLDVCLWFFTISREVSHYAFLSVAFYNKTFLMKILEDIFAMPVAKE